VTLLLACHATGSHKIPVAFIGSAAVPLRFKLSPANCPLPYFSQLSTWIDADERCVNTEIVPDLRARARSLIVLMVNN